MYIAYDTYVGAKMLKKDRRDIVKPLEVNDDELLLVHTQEYISSLKVKFLCVHNKCLYFIYF